MKKLIQILSVLAFVLPMLACEYDEYDAPALGEGECSYEKRWVYSQTVAQSAMDAAVAIIESSTIGNLPVAVIRKEVYVSSRYNGDDETWGFQIVFSCSKAAIKIEEGGMFEAENGATRAANTRWENLVVEYAGYVKKLLQKTNSFSHEDCETCTDSDGNSYSCNCTSWTDYNYNLEYMTVVPNSSTSGKFSNAEQKALFLKNDVTQVIAAASLKANAAEKRVRKGRVLKGYFSQKKH